MAFTFYLVYMVTERELFTTSGYQKGVYVYFINLDSHLMGFSEIISENNFFHDSFC